jgi:hypothetical protein
MIALTPDDDDDLFCFVLFFFLFYFLLCIYPPCSAPASACAASLAALSARHTLHSDVAAAPLARLGPVVTGATYSAESGVLTLFGRRLCGDAGTAVAVRAGPGRTHAVTPLAASSAMLSFALPAGVAAQLCVVTRCAVPGARAPPVRLASAVVTVRVGTDGVLQIAAAGLGAAARCLVEEDEQQQDQQHYHQQQQQQQLATSVNAAPLPASLDTGCGPEALRAVLSGGFAGATGSVLATLRHGRLSEWCAAADARGFSNLAVALFLHPAAVCYPLIAHAEASWAEVAAEVARLETEHNAPAACSLGSGGEAAFVQWCFAARESPAYQNVMETGRLRDLARYPLGYEGPIDDDDDDGASNTSGGAPVHAAAESPAAPVKIGSAVAGTHRPAVKVVPTEERQMWMVRALRKMLA